MSDLISRQAAIDALNGIINRFEQILRDIRESKVDDSVCGMCEYDGAFVGESGDWCNECPGFEKDDCFRLSDECRKRWLESVGLPAAQPEITLQAAIDYLHSIGWMQEHDRILTESAQPEQQIPQMRGWVCPVCGRGLSPYTSVCPCNNGKGWEITC